MRALLVTNPHASSMTARASDVIGSALGSSVDLTVTTTTSRGHARDLAAQAAQDKFDLVFVHGGDGTVNEAINGLLGDGDPADPDLIPERSSLPVLGIVPGGNANVMARSLGLPNEAVEATGALLDAVRAGRWRSVGLGRADERWFGFNAGLGLDAEVVAAVEQARSRGRSATSGLYVRRALTQFLRDTDRSSPALTVSVPARNGRPAVRAQGLFLAIVQNTAPWTYLGPRELNPSPRADFDLGLDLFGLTSLDIIPTLRHVQQILADDAEGPRGKEVVRLHDEQEITLTAARPTALQVDGDSVGTISSVVLRSVPKALRILV